MNFVQQLAICGKNTDLFMQPLPLDLGQLRFSIERHRAGFNRIHPSYYLYLEKPSGGHVQVLYAKKRSFNKTSNYLISLKKTRRTGRAMFVWESCELTLKETSTSCTTTEKTTKRSPSIL